jgi:cytochrome c-type biogenesis protein CcmF
VFLFNNLFFLVALVTVFVGTLYPLLMEVLKFKKVSVGPPYYNTVFMPVALGLILLMGIGPYIPWRKASLQNLKDLFVMPTLIAFMGLGLFFVVGIRSLYALAGLAVVCFVGGAIFLDFAKIASFWAKRDQVNHVQGFVSAYRKNPRRMAGIITHIGVLVMMVGIIFSTIYQQEQILIMKPGEEVKLNSYKFKMVSLYPAEGVNWAGQEALFAVYRGDELIAQLHPQKRFYSVSQTPTTETAIHQVNMGHLFITIPEVSPDGTWARVRALHNPLVLWVWYGGGIMGLGVILNIFRGGRKKVTEPHPAAVSSDVVVGLPRTPSEGVLQAESTPPPSALNRLRPGRKEV